MFIQLPLTANGYDTLNQTTVDCPQVITVGEDNSSYHLKSAVFAELYTPVVNSADKTYVSSKEIVIGTSAIVFCPDGKKAYRPVAINTQFISGDRTSPNASPIFRLTDGTNDTSDPEILINNNGLVVFYQKSS
jgi:hypothetical protein